MSRTTRPLIVAAIKRENKSHHPQKHGPNGYRRSPSPTGIYSIFGIYPQSKIWPIFQNQNSENKVSCSVNRRIRDSYSLSRTRRVGIRWCEGSGTVTDTFANWVGLNVSRCSLPLDWRHPHILIFLSMQLNR